MYCAAYCKVWCAVYEFYIVMLCGAKEAVIMCCGRLNNLISEPPPPPIKTTSLKPPPCQPSGQSQSYVVSQMPDCWLDSDILWAPVLGPWWRSTRVKHSVVEFVWMAWACSLSDSNIGCWVEVTRPLGQGIFSIQLVSTWQGCHNLSYGGNKWGGG